jgi:hypothetical protein
VNFIWNLNVNHFKMVWEWKLLHLGPLNGITCQPYMMRLPSSSNVISGGHTDIQTGDLISLLSFLKSRLQTNERKTYCPRTATFSNKIVMFVCTRRNITQRNHGWQPRFNGRIIKNSLVVEFSKYNTTVN